MNMRYLLLGMPVAVVLGATPAVVEYMKGDPNAPTPVLVANQLIPRGTLGNYIQSHRMSMETRFPRSKVDEGAIPYTHHLRGRMSVTDIFPGQQLTEADFWP
jgi:hypothetical protein